MKTLFLSDLHIGCRYAQTGKALELLKSVDFDKLVLVGDIIDLWQIKKGSHFKKDDLLLLAKLVKIAAKKQVIYCYGNHDADIVDFDGLEGDNFLIVKEYVHRTSDGKQFLVTHGDLYDTTFSWVEKLGDSCYYYIVWLDYLVERIFSRKVSLSSFLRKHAKAAAMFLANFEDRLVSVSQKRGCDGVICGHVHVAKNEEKYKNCGDWLGECTALFEECGEFSIIK